MSTTVTRAKICDAAIRITVRDGLLAMPLDAVAKEGGISKGGMVYHFPSKDELIRGVLDYFSQQFETMQMRRVVDDPEPRLRWARCMLDCMFPKSPTADARTDDGQISSDVLNRFFMAMLTDVVTCPAAMQPLRQLATRMRNRFMSDPKEGMDQILVWLAIDGLFLWQFMGIIDSNDPLITHIGESLRVRIKATLEMDSGGTSTAQTPLTIDANSALRSES